MPQGMELGDATRPVIKQRLPTPLFPRIPTVRVLRNDRQDLVRLWLNAQVSQGSLRDRVHGSQRDARGKHLRDRRWQSIGEYLDIVIHLNGYDVVLATGGKTLS